ncbi:hypothetical protein L195_g041992, partial [Trifolium pratense]
RSEILLNLDVTALDGGIAAFMAAMYSSEFSKGLRILCGCACLDGAEEERGADELEMQVINDAQVLLGKAFVQAAQKGVAFVVCFGVCVGVMAFDGCIAICMAAMYLSGFAKGLRIHCG